VSFLKIRRISGLSSHCHCLLGYRSALFFSMKRRFYTKAFIVSLTFILLITIMQSLFVVDEKRLSRKSRSKTCSPTSSPHAKSSWNLSSALQADKEYDFSLSSKSTETFTVLINTFKRRSLLKRAVAHYSKCENVSNIRVVWSEQVKPPSALNQTEMHDYFARHFGFVQYDTHRTTSIQNRYARLVNLKTQAVFHVDDDVRIPCHSLESGFQQWKKHKDALVGFEVRAHELVGDGCISFRYNHNRFDIWWKKRYSITLTKAAFSHAKYLLLYETNLPSDVRSYVDQRTNCEDIAMQMLVSSIVRGKSLTELKSATVYVPASTFYKITSKLEKRNIQGISSNVGHIETRSNCISDLSIMFMGDSYQTPLYYAT